MTIFYPYFYPYFEKVQIIYMYMGKEKRKTQPPTEKQQTMF